MFSSSTAPAGYADWLASRKTRIRETRLRAALAVNNELIGLYWRIGQDIVERQDRDSWGTKVVDRLAADLRVEFPASRGFSSAHLRYMRAFAEAWSDPTILQRIVGKLPWGQNIELLGFKDSAARLWYAALAHGWSRPVLAVQIDTKVRERQGHALTNFGRVPPPETSDLAQQMLKDLYQFDFLTMGEAAKERDVERALVARVKDLLLELGKGFSFIGSPHHLEIRGQSFYVDLLFCHRKLRCLVAVDLKMGQFQPEHGGKMAFYLAALDESEREEGENPSIGLILCRAHNRIVVEYALRNVDAPLGDCTVSGIAGRLPAYSVRRCSSVCERPGAGYAASRRAAMNWGPIETWLPCRRQLSRISRLTGTGNDGRIWPARQRAGAARP